MGKPSKRQAKPKPEEAVECPRCESSNTKFCYYNNNSLSQPRYLCKSCRRYWTKGGTLRNITVVEGGCRKNKKSSSSSSSSKKIKDQTLTPNTNPLINTHHNLIDTTGDLRQQYDHQDSDRLSCLGNPSLDVAGSVADPVLLGNLDDFWGFRNDNFGDNGGRSVGFNGETTMLYNNEDMIGSTLMTTTTTSNVGAVATMKHDSTDNISDLWSLPWQLIEDSGGNNNYNNMVVGFDLDSATDNWHDFFHSI